MSLPTPKRRKLSAGEKHEADNSKQSSQGHQGSAKPATSRSQSDALTAEAGLASGLYKSNLFKFQIDELLSQLRPDHDKQLTRVEKTLRKLKAIIEEIPDIPPKKISEAEKDVRKRSGTFLPFPEPRPAKDAKYTLEYAKPASVNVVGSFARKSEVRSSKNNVIDLAVTMPSTLFQRKDYLNYRYFHKRAYYVACMAAGIKDTTESGFKISYSYQDGDTLRPVILLEPDELADEAFVRSKSSIRILTAIEESVFPIPQTLPTVNNVRQSDPNDDPTVPTSERHEPTPIYNAVLRSESSVSAFLKLLHTAAVKCTCFRDACILGRTWLRQRGFDTSFARGGFGHFEWSALVALLLEGGGPNGRPILSPSYSSYQIFKATIQFISGRDLTQPLMLFAAGVSPFPKSNSPVLYDGKRGLNLLYKMSVWSYKLLRHEARLTLKMLNDSLHDHFDRVFIMKIDEPLKRFDQVFSISYQGALGSTPESVKYQNSLHQVLTRALGNRVRLIHVEVPGMEPRSIGSPAPRVKPAQLVITVGLFLEPEHLNRVVDHGPAAGDRDSAAEFRAFWGEKAELRRFKDGSIVESLVWSDPRKSRSVIQQIVTHILHRHFDLASGNIDFAGDHKLLPESCYDKEMLDPMSPFQPALDAFASLEKLLQDMEDLPLTLHQLSAADPLLRYTPTHSLSSGRSAPADVVVQFEGSVRWPDNLIAIQMTKVAFLLKIGELLEATGQVATCRVGLENENSRIMNSAFLDVAFPDIITFRLRIYYDREQTLLERQLKDSGSTARAKEEAAFALAAHRRTFIQSVRLTQAVRVLATRFPALAPTIRLLKKWANAHLLPLHIRGELLELVVCQVFLHPYPWDPPSSAVAGLLRTLDLLSRWDWQHEPLIVDLNEELGAEELSGIRTRFDAWRNVDPLMNNVAMFVASNLDPDGVTWTQFAKPPKVVAARLSSLAKAATKLVKDKGFNVNMSEVFRAPLADYDFLLHLNPKYRSSSRKGGPIVFKNLQGSNFNSGEASSDPVSDFVNELTRLYGDAILLFRGDEESKVVAGLWNPQAVKPRSWALKAAWSTLPLVSDEREEEKNDTTLNKTAVLNEIATLGGELIHRVQMNR